MPSGIPVNVATLEHLPMPAHVAVFYDNLDEWVQLVDYQVQLALARQEKCICLAPENDRNSLRTFVEERGRESNRPSWRNNIILLASSYFSELLIESGPESVIEALLDTVKAALIEGCSGVSLIINFDSLLIQHYGESSLVLFAQQLHAKLGKFPCRYYGIYDYQRYSLNHLQQLFVLHDHFVRNFHLYKNTFSSIGQGFALVGNAEWLDRIVFTMSVQEDGRLWPNIVSHSFHSLALFNEDGYLEYCNPAFCSLSGYSKTQLQGINLAEFLEQAGFQSLPVLKAGEKVHFCVDKYHTPDKEIGLEFLVYGATDSSGRTFYALSLADISETQRISDQLQEREEELQALLESINDTVFIMDKNQKYTGIYGNGIFEEDLNHNIFLGKTPAEIYVPDKAELFSQANKKALSGERATYEYTLGSGSSLRYYHTALAPIRNKYRQITGLVGISRNITEVKTAQAELEKNLEEMKALNEDLEFYQKKLINKNEQLHESQQRLEMALWGAREAYCDWDLESNLVTVDDRFGESFNLNYLPGSERVFTADEWMNIIHPDDRALFRATLIAGLKGETSHIEQEYRVKLGEDWIWLLYKGSVVSRDSQGRALRVVGTYQDVDVKKKAIQALADSEQRYQRLFEQSPIGLVRFDACGVISDANTRFLELMGSKSKEELKAFNLFFSPEAVEAGLEERVKESLAVKEASQGELLFQIPGGKRIWLRYNIDPVLNPDGTLKEVIMACEDYTDRKTNEMKIMYLSFHDRLTGLYNRAFFEEELKRIDVERQLPLSIAMGDVNGLKLVNDAFGHQEGDRLLRKIADVLRQSCREEDIIARWGGDEFIILLPQTDIKTAANICERIKRNAAAVETTPITPSMALGYATKENTSQNIMDILKKAENDMYLNKLLESKNTRNAIISSLENTLWDRTVETREHTERMQRIALRMAAGMGMRKHDADKLMLLAKLHDIGKIGIPGEVLRKPSSLVPEEWDAVKKHSEIGYRIVNASPELSIIAEEILSHHERWNGQGYPRGLKGDEIPQLARIISIIDAYDVMTHETPYKPPISHEQALYELQRNAGLQFDPKLVEIFVYNFA